MLMRLTPQLDSALARFSPLLPRKWTHVCLITKNHKIKINQIRQQDTGKKNLAYIWLRPHERVHKFAFKWRGSRKRQIVWGAKETASWTDSFVFSTRFFSGLVSLAMNATNGLIRLGATTSWGVHHVSTYIPCWMCVSYRGRVHKKPAGWPSRLRWTIHWHGNLCF